MRICIILIHKNYKTGKILRILFIYSIILALALFGCDDTLTNKKIDDVVIPSSNVSFGSHIQPLLLVKCAYSGCHDQASSSNKFLNLTTYSGITSDPLIVYPFSPETSKLVWAIKGQSGSYPMPPPPNTAPLNQNQITGIETWVKEGAKNN